jgi:transcriptional regulator with XRE-family HTH domain
MTADEFTTALDVLGWKQSDLARRLDLDKNTPSRWANGRTPVPGWAGEYMRAMLALQRLHAEFVQVPRGRDHPPADAAAPGAESGPSGQAPGAGTLI